MRIRVPVEMLNDASSRLSNMEIQIAQNGNTLNKVWADLRLEAKSRAAVESKVNQVRTMAGRLSSETSSLSKYLVLVINRFQEADGKAAQKMAIANKAILYDSGQQESGVDISLKNIFIPLLLVGGPALILPVVMLGWIKQLINKEQVGHCLLRGSQKRACSVSVSRDGTKIITPSDIDRKRQILTVKRVEKYWHKMPKALTKHTSEIQILDFSNPDDKYWSEKLNTEFRSAATAGFGEIHIYPGLSNIPYLGDSYNIVNDTFSDILCHEAAHNLDRNVSGDHSWFSDSDTWKQAVSSDNNGFVSSYAKLSYDGYINSNAISGHYVEDFADSVKLLYRDRELFQDKYPNRYEILRGLMEDS